MARLPSDASAHGEENESKQADESTDDEVTDPDPAGKGVGGEHSDDPRDPQNEREGSEPCAEQRDEEHAQHGERGTQ
jgi:hypothetical protein